MQKRLTLLISGLVIATVVLFSLLSVQSIRATHYEDVKTRLTTTSRLIADNLERVVTPGFDYDAFASQAAAVSGSRVTIISPKGAVLGESDTTSGAMENHFFREEVQKAYTGSIGFSVRFSKTLKQDMLYVANPLKDPDGQITVVRVASPMKTVNQLMQKEIAWVLLIAFLGIAASLVVSHQFVSQFLKPIRNLSAVSARMAEGQYGLRIMEESQDEIGELTRNFNLMSEKLHENMENSKASAVKTQAILSSMINGIIAVDNDRRVMFINPVAEVLLNIREEKVRGHHVMEIIRSNLLNDCLERFLASDQIATADIEIFEPQYRILSVSTTPILAEQQERLGGVILLQDVSEIRKLEQMRKDFVANVSHELKTPLTSIQGFVETLKAGAAEQKPVRDKFLDIIEIESVRLSALIDDLLTLSSIENRSQYASKDSIQLKLAVQEVLEMLSEQAQKKGITLTLDAPAALPLLDGNAGWFKQMIINLVDNAIKYTPEQGMVHVELSASRDDLEIRVSDTGIGIEPEYQERLFERFYRVDKARSREVGGTGLGLAIVKHIAIAMGGQVAVSSTPGEGSVFTLRLPLGRRTDTPS